MSVSLEAETDAGNVTTHADIAQEIRRRILTAQYRVGQRIPPERELLETFGCSRMTVARALALLAEEGLIERHRGRGTFVARHGERAGLVETDAGRSSGRLQTRGNVIKYISPGQGKSVRSSRDDVLSGLHGVLNEAGYHVSVDFYADIDEHLRCLERVYDPQIAGVVLWPDPDPRTVQAVAGLMAQGVPIVLIDTYLPGIDGDHVVTDNVEGAATMVRHLAQRGHRRICYLTPPPNRTSLRDRLTGFLRGLVEEDLPLDRTSVVRLPPSGPGESALAADAALGCALATLLSSATPPTALFASNDALALAAMQWLRERQVRVPVDLTVVGYDGIEAGEFGPAPLTTVKQDFREMAVTAARILLERFDGRTAPLRYHRLIEPRLIERATCAAPGGRRTTERALEGSVMQDAHRGGQT